MKSDETLTNCNKHRRACSDITMILKQKSPKARADSLNESYSSIDKTPFERIISKRNLIRNAIPEFMTEKKTKQRAWDYTDAFKRKSILNIDTNPKPSSLILTLISTEPCSANSTDKKNLLEDLLMIPLTNPSETVITIKHISLSRDELHNLVSHKAVSKNLVDCYMWILKQENRILARQNAHIPQIIIASASFTRKIFAYKKSSSTCNIFKYELLLLPFYDINWCLFSVNFKTNVVEFYNPTSNEIKIEEKLIAIYNFLRKELKRFENKDIEDGRLRRISYRKAIINSSLRCEDAPIFVMKMVKNICMGENQEVTQDEICNTRLEVFNLLVAYSA